MTSTIHVEDRYVVKAGESLHFRDQTGIELDGDGGWDSSASLVLNGAVTVVGKGEAQVSGVVDQTANSSVEIGRRGTLTVTSTVTAIGVDWAAELDNAGAISATTTGGGMAAGVRLMDEFGALTNTGSITASGGQYTYGVLGGFEIHNRGSIVAASQAGDIFGAAVQSFYLDNQGRVEMTGVIGVGAVVSYLDNGGLIRAESPNGAGAVILQAGGWLHNSGRIIAEGEGGSYAISLAAFGESAPTLLENSGLIVGDVAHGRIPTSPVELDNSGRILGDVMLGWGADQVHDGGLIKGEVQLLDGDDVFQVEGEGRVTGPVHGDGGDDLLVGGAGGEALYGDGREESEAPGADTLQGNGGADTLTGGAGGDVFVYAAVGDSTSAHADLITDLEAGDSIDLSAIDADAGVAGDQAFHLVAHFSGRAGEATLSYVAVSDVTVLSADVDGDRVADLVVRIEGDHRDFAGLVL